MVIRKAVSLITVLTLLLSSGLQVAAEETEPADIDTVPAEEEIIIPEEQEEKTSDQSGETENPADESELTEEAEPVPESEPEENEPVVIPEESSDGESGTGEQDEEQLPDEEPQEESTESVEQINVFYTAHLSRTGWTPVYTNGETSRYGRVEAFTIYTDSSPEELTLSYQVHVQNIGWMNPVGMNEIAGTTGRSLQIEAIRINLSGSQAINYNVFYRTYVDGYGWTDWAVNGKTSGSEGFGKAVCQTEIKILSTDDNSITPGLAPRINDAPLQYNAHVQNIGWQKYVITPAMAGTTGRSLRLESVNIRLTNGFEKKGGLQGRAHVQNLGWINSSSYPAGMTLGTVGKSLRLEAIELSLTGDLADQYDIYYRTHVQQLGWMGWAHNGEPSGSSGKSLAIEAIEIRIVTKGANVFFLDGKACFSEKLKVGFQNETINGKTVKVYYDENHNIVKKGFKLNQVYYQVDENTGAIIHEQKLFTDKIFLEGIDISEHNGDVDLSKYQNGFVIIRIGWWTTPDKKAIRNMDLCEKYNIPYGVYLYDYTTQPKEAVKEAEFTLSMIKGRNIQCGVWFDMEDADGWKERNDLPADDERISKICQAYCETIQKAGYHVGIYASYYWFEHYIHDVDQYDKWVAHWGKNDGNWNKDLSGYASMHQYTSTGGIDKDVMYVDPSLFR